MHCWPKAYALHHSTDNLHVRLHIRLLYGLFREPYKYPGRYGCGCRYIWPTRVKSERI